MPLVFPILTRVARNCHDKNNTPFPFSIFLKLWESTTSKLVIGSPSSWLLITVWQ